jgi:hypothetical protein
MQGVSVLQAWPSNQRAQHANQVTKCNFVSAPLVWRIRQSCVHAFAYLYRFIGMYVPLSLFVSS